jgi:molecular chaperone GrpE
MDEDNTPKNASGDDDTYVIEDTGQSVDEIEHEMERTANEAVQEQPAPADPPAAAGADEEKRQLHDRYLRTLADFENFRRRAEREKNDFHRYALANLIKDVLPVLDNFDRALEHAEEGDDFHKGVLMIYKQLFDVLQRYGVRTIEETGVPFDPNIHEAVIREEDPSVPSHTVTATLQKGYFLHDRLLRPAMVKVAVGGPE